jgi:membrane-bound inhibitor of C-type lysozyme
LELEAAADAAFWTCQASPFLMRVAEAGAPLAWAVTDGKAVFISGVFAQSGRLTP